MSGRLDTRASSVDTIQVCGFSGSRVALWHLGQRPSSCECRHRAQSLREQVGQAIDVSDMIGCPDQGQSVPSRLYAIDDNRTHWLRSSRTSSSTLYSHASMLRAASGGPAYGWNTAAELVCDGFFAFSLGSTGFAQDNDSRLAPQEHPSNSSILDICEESQQKLPHLSCRDNGE